MGRVYRNLQTETFTRVYTQWANLLVLVSITGRMVVTLRGHLRTDSDVDMGYGRRDMGTVISMREST
jgi:hypothetical protein